MRLTNLDALRGLLAIFVMIFHYDTYYMPSFEHNFFVREAGNFVTFFFILSGFIVSNNYPQIDMKKFLQRRFLRLFPLLLYSSTIFLLFMCAGIFLFKDMLSFDYKLLDIFKSYFDGVFFTNSTPLFRQNVIINPPSWSVSAEMISYIFFVFFIRFKTKIPNQFYHIIIAVVILLMLLKNNFFSTPFAGFLIGILSFNTGMIINEIYLKKKKLKAKPIMVLLYVALIPFYFFITFIFFNDFFYKKIIDLLVYQFLFGFLVLIFAFSNLKILNNKFFQFLGKISYSIYLNHAIVLIIIPKVIFNIIVVR